MARPPRGLLTQVTPTEERPSPGPVKATSIKATREMHTAAIIIRGRYAKENPQITISDAIWEFIKERDPELAEETLEAIRMQDRLNQLYGGAATTS